MTNNPLVSVIVPTYNQAWVLTHALRSIKEQNYSPLEVLVCDDGSTDNTADVVKNLGLDFVRYMRIPHNGKHSATLNAGIREARGEIIMFLDGDDQWLPGKISKQVAYLRAHPECDMMFSDGWRIETESDQYLTPNPDKDVRYCPGWNADKVVEAGDLFPENQIPVPTIAFRRGFLKVVGMPDESLVMWDWEWPLRAIAKGGNVRYQNEQFFIYRKWPKSITSSRGYIYSAVPEKIRISQIMRGRLDPSVLDRQLQRWKYDYVKEAIKFEKIPSLKDLTSSDYFPDGFFYRLKALYYLALTKFRRKFLSWNPQ
ncbi:MAG: glycosyltransferase family 2 protein [Nitrospinae bacterium]|nr:glycosyltransferase family 2 protein [Nitrospinota bacterium]